MNYIVNESRLTAIADAIRSKNNTSEAMTVETMPNKIQAIDTQEDLDAELSTQDNLIAQIMTELESKAAAAPAEIPTCTVTIDATNMTYINGVTYMVVEDGSIVSKKMGRQYTNDTANDVRKRLPITLQNVVCGSIVDVRWTSSIVVATLSNCEELWNIHSSSSLTASIYVLSTENGAQCTITGDDDM